MCWVQFQFTLCLVQFQFTLCWVQFQFTLCWVCAGLETFSQLISATEDGKYQIPAFKTDDSATFRYRGFMIDTSRHYLDLQTIYDHIVSGNCLSSLGFNMFVTIPPFHLSSHLFSLSPSSSVTIPPFLPFFLTLSFLDCSLPISPLNSSCTLGCNGLEQAQCSPLAYCRRPVVPVHKHHLPRHGHNGSHHGNSHVQ